MERDRKRGRMITILREGLLLTRHELAEKAGVSNVTVLTAEQGDREMRIKTVKKLAKALNVDPVMLYRADERVLLERTDEPATSGPYPLDWNM